MLVDRGLAETRAKAQALILAGRVQVNDRIEPKAGTMISVEAKIELLEGPRFVSRGGEKLEGALRHFQINPAGLVCLDVGASTGGFTDCLLQHGATFVYAVDVGTSQLHDSLRKDPRVVSIEQTHILNLGVQHFQERPTLAVIDVSFISLRKVLPQVCNLLQKDSVVLALVKPQFEVGARFLKKGVVRSAEIQLKAVTDIIRFAEENSFRSLGFVPARIKGPKGNQEYFVHMKTVPGA